MSAQASKDGGSSSEKQALLFANDVARLYRRLRDDGARLARLEGRLRELARISIDLVETASAEAAGDCLVREIAAALGGGRVAVYVTRGGRFRLLTSVGEAPLRTSLTREDTGELGSAASDRSGMPWRELGLGEPVLVVPFRGRARNVVGFAAARAPNAPADLKEALGLLARFAGVLIEAHLLEETHLESRRPLRLSTTAAAADSRELAVASLRGESSGMRKIRELVLQVASAPVPVLVLGETGTGKELVARAIHDASQRRKGTFVALNCGALPEALVESEIFGHEAGAFTGAQKKHRGKVELAHGGTFFLDELGEMPHQVQVKLLRFLQDGRYAPLGAESERSADVRIVAATNRSVQSAIAVGALREDLMFRLNVFTIELPPLRERGNDIMILARTFAKDFAVRLERPEPRFAPAAEKALLGYAWPGNVRELRNVVERGVILSADGSIGEELVPRSAKRSELARADRSAAMAQAEPLAPEPIAGLLELATTPANEELRTFAEAKADFLARFEAAYCQAVLERCGGNIARAARLAGMDRKNLHRKVRAYGIDTHGKH